MDELLKVLENDGIELRNVPVDVWLKLDKIHMTQGSDSITPVVFGSFQFYFNPDHEEDNNEDA